MSANKEKLRCPVVEVHYSYYIWCRIRNACHVIGRSGGNRLFGTRQIPLVVGELVGPSGHLRKQKSPGRRNVGPFPNGQ